MNVKQTRLASVEWCGDDGMSAKLVKPALVASRLAAVHEVASRQVPLLALHDVVAPLVVRPTKSSQQVHLAVAAFLTRAAELEAPQHEIVQVDGPLSHHRPSSLYCRRALRQVRFSSTGKGVRPGAHAT